ncbi:MAG TPA: ATP-dependent zinc metalloprotease FtsH [Cyclobacteriaceae bacterium]|nr:ATP-dependent zinc metalloprotease FtsH [Cyclobacteriaceae bacterium]
MNEQREPGKRSVWPSLTWIAIFIVTAFIVFVAPALFGRPTVTTWNEFESKMLRRGAVDHLVVLNKETVQVYIKKEFAADTLFREVMNTAIGVSSGPHYVFTVGSVESFERKMDLAQQDVPQDNRIAITYVEQKSWTNLLGWIIPLVLLIIMTRFLFSQRSNGTGPGSLFSFGRTTAKLFEDDGKSKVTFDEVAGLEEAKIEIKEIVDYLKNPERYMRLGAKIPKGVIIIGPPGTGKTLLAKAVAGEAQVPFFSLSGAEFVEMFVGVGASRVRDLFKRAKEKAPCIVFIDEIDAVGRSRGKNAIYSGSNDERESTLNQLLTEMDGFGTNSGVIVLAATNRPDILDTALLRPGRFDRHIYLELPTLLERKQIFGVHLRSLLLDKNVDADVLASQTPGFSGADIANICNEAALIAARGKQDRVDQQNLLDAIDRILGGLEKKSKIISADEKKVIAIHESGHAIVSWMLDSADPLIKVSIIPRDKSLGAAWYQPSERIIQSQRYFEHRLTTALAGRAAEEIIFKDVSSGALDDLEKSTKDAYAMVTYLGFNKKVGMVSFYDSTGSYQSSIQKPYSEDTAAMIDQEVRDLVERCYENAKRILTDNRKRLLKMAVLLIRKEIIRQEDIQSILGQRPAKAPLRELVTNGYIAKEPLLLNQFNEP